MARQRREGESEPLTLGHAHASRVRLIVRCKACGRQAEPELGAAPLTVIEWAARLACSRCGARDAAFVFTGAQR